MLHTKPKARKNAFCGPIKRLGLCKWPTKSGTSRSRARAAFCLDKKLFPGFRIAGNNVHAMLGR
jgi:hypothetical protein